MIYHMLTSAREEGGAEITPKQGQWKNVESIFPLQDLKFNNKWIREWSAKTFLQAGDLDEIRDRLGEKVLCPSLLLRLSANGLQDCVLFRLHTIVLRLLNISRCLWVFFVDPSWPLLSYLRHSERFVVYRLR